MKKNYFTEESALTSQLIKDINGDAYQELFDTKYIKKGCKLKDCHFRNTLTAYIKYHKVAVLSFDTDERTVAETFLTNFDKYQPFQKDYLEEILDDTLNLYNSYEYGIQPFKNITWPEKWIDLLPTKNKKRYYNRFRFKIPTHNRNVKGVLRKSNLLIDFAFKYIEQEHRLIPVAIISPPLGAANQGMYFISMDKNIKSIWQSREFKEISKQDFLNGLENSLEKYWYNQVFKVIGKKEYPNKKYKDMTQEERDGYKILANMMAI